LCATAIIGLASPAAQAAETKFTGNIDTDWSNATNWSNGVPSGSTQAVIESTATSNTEVTLAAKMFVGKNSAGILTINDSVFTVNNNIVLANSSASLGTINIINASFSNPGRLVELGRSGVGKIVLHEGSISAKQYFLGRNANGDGALHVKSGTVTISSEIRVGTGSSSKGKITLDDGVITVPTLTFGYASGSNGLLVLNDGAITVAKLALGRVASSSVALELNGGVLQIDTLANVGGDDENIKIAGGILRLKQSSRSAFDTLLANNSLNWTPSVGVAGYEIETADETIDNANGTLYIRNDDDGYFSVWSTTPITNYAPIFTNSTIMANFAELDQDYNATLSGAATDENDDVLTYSITSGPAWLNINDDGALSGKPSAGDVGANSFTVEVSDGNDGSATAILKIWVAADFTELSFDDFQDGWGNWLDGGEDAQLARTYAIERRAARGNNRRSMHPHTTSFSEQAVGLQDNSGVASSTTLANVLDLTAYDELKIDFTYLPILFRDDDNFMLRYSSDGGENWQTIKTFVNGVDLNSGTREVVELILDRSEIDFTDNALLRFQVDANGNSADVYIDNIKVSSRATLNRNNAPVFASDTITADPAHESLNYSGSLSNFVNDIDGDNLTLTKVNGPDWLTVATDGTLGGTPATANIGVNSFAVQVDDGRGGIANATLEVTVILAGNNPPVFTSSIINADDANEKELYQATIAGSATDLDSDTLTYAKTNGSGWLTISADGGLSGTPNYAGTFTFDVRVSDDNGGSATAQLKIKAIAEPNEAPVFIETPLNNAIERAPYTEKIIATDADGHNLTYTKESGPSWLVVSTDGMLSGSPTTADIGSNEFIFKASDGKKSVETTFTITVVESVNAPIFTSAPVIGAHGTEGVAYIGSLIAAATDADFDPLTFSKLSGPSWLSIAANGVLSGTPTSVYVGLNTFTVKVSDGNDGTATATLNITIFLATGNNTPPSFNTEPIQGYNALAGSVYNGTIAGSASDSDGDPLTYAKISGPTWLNVAGNGALTGTPETAGNYTFTVQVSDDKGGSASTTLNITVTAPVDFTQLTYDDFDTGFGNWLDGGVHAKIAQGNCVEGECVNFQANGEESTITLAEGLDLTGYNSLKVGFSFKTKGMKSTEGFFIEQSIDGGQNWSIIKTLVQGVDFTNELATTLNYVFTDNEINFTDNTLVRFRANGGGTGHDIYIDNIATSAAYINYLPVFVNDPINAANAARGWEYSASIADLVTDKNGDALTFAKVDGPTWLTLAIDGTLSGTPELADIGHNSFTVKVDDGAGGITPAILSITVEASLAPIFDSEQLSKDNAVENSDYHASIASDATDPDGDPLSFSKVAGPSWLTVATDGTLSGTPTAADIGINSFTFAVADSFGGTDTASLSIHVGAASGGYPQFKQVPTSAEWALSFALSGTDKDADANLDGDNLDNFHEYAYGGDPLSSNDEHVVRDIQINGNAFTVSHTRLRNATSLGIHYQFQVAKDANAPHWLDVTPDDINVALLSDAYELVTYSGVLPFSHRATGIGRLITTRTGPFANQGTELELKSAELDLNDHITTKSGNIYEDWFGNAAPQGIVDNNSPWMHVRIPFPGDPEWPKDRGTRLYHYKLSQDPTLTVNVITETPKRWSFFNPSRKLAEGSWYWTAGHSTVTDPDNIEWLGDTYQFDIKGSEEQYVTPSADAVWEIAQQKTEPKLLMRENDFGTLLDIQDTTSDAVIAQADKLIAQGVTNAEGKAQADTVAQLVLAYGASGDTLYRDEALAGYDNVSPTAASGFGIRTFLGMGIAFLEIMGNELDPAMETELVANMLEVAKVTPEGFISTMLDRYEHVNYESHVVQKSIHIIMFAGLAIGDRHAEAEEMFKYAYELWLYKGPHGGRSDGSWHNGFGYMSVNEDQLAATPWILGELTGFDYMMHPWYRNNAKAISYLRAYGNPGQYYGDRAADGYGITTGGPAADISSLHLYTHPENRWMHWQTQHATGNSLLNKVKKMADQWQRWLNLPIRKHYVEPTPGSVQTPIATADAYRDVGYVAAHSNITDSATNFMTTMRSSPFSSAHKSHASQNAFTTAYGGKPLFYRTGWRKKGLMDDYRMSKAFNLIMPNDVSQKRGDKSAYAYLPRFAHGDRMSYWIGDASNTYPEATGVNRFRRHMVHLKPNILVIYDEIDSSEAATTWTYTLNAHNEIKTQSDNIISVHNTLGLATANLYSSSPLLSSVTGPTEKHWNSRMTTTEQSPSVRFINVIELTPSTDINEVIAALPATGTDLITITAGLKTIDAGDDYTVIAQLDPNQPARLEIRSSDGNVALLYGAGVNTLSVDGKVVLSGRYKSSTLFMEKNTQRGDIVEELVDELPDSITYSNKY